MGMLGKKGRNPRTEPLIPHSKLAVPFGLQKRSQQNPASYVQLSIPVKSTQCSAKIFSHLAFLLPSDLIVPPAPENRHVDFETGKNKQQEGGGDQERGEKIATNFYFFFF